MRKAISNQRPSSVVEFKNKNQNKEGIKIGDDGICEATVNTTI